MFHKTMSVNDFNQYFHEEKHGFLVVQAFDETCHGFNLKCPGE
jgi:hypothetical protein